MVKKLILLGLGLTLLVGLPLAIFVMQNQTQTKSGAAASTKFSFGVPANPINIGDTIDVPINVDPQGANSVSFVKITFTYDGNKLDKGSDTPVTFDTTKFIALEKPGITCNDSNTCTVTFALSVGSNDTAVIKSKTAIASIKLKAKANTDPGTPTKLSFVQGQNQALSTAQGDQAAENVFQAGQDGLITIGADSSGGGDTPTPTGSGGGTDTPTPTGAGGGGGGTGGGSGSGGGGTTNGGNISVTCSSLAADVTSGNAPLDVTFTTAGNATNDSIVKISLNYGDGNVDTIASGSGIGTAEVNAQITHTYQRNGTFTAKATLTTGEGSMSNPASCSRTITVGSGVSGNLPPTGPGETILFVGAAGAVITAIGLALIAGL